MAHQATLFPVTETESPAIRVAQVLSALLIPLCTVATVVGFVVPGFYRATPYWVLQAHAQDLVTLVVAVPLIAIVLGWLFLRSVRPSTAESSKDYWLAAS